VSRLLTVEATLLIFLLGAFVTTSSAQKLLVLPSQILKLVGEHNHLLHNSRSSSESPSGDSSSDSTNLRALDDFPLDGRAIDFVFLANSCSLRLISRTLRELTVGTKGVSQVTY